jgi:hypothetical protein
MCTITTRFGHVMRALCVCVCLLGCCIDNKIENSVKQLQEIHKKLLQFARNHLVYKIESILTFPINLG